MEYIFECPLSKHRIQAFKLRVYDLSEVFDQSAENPTLLHDEGPMKCELSNLPKIQLPDKMQDTKLNLRK